MEVLVIFLCGEDHIVCSYTAYATHTNDYLSI